MKSFLISIAGIVGMMVIWVFIQMLWKRVFADFHHSEDALKGRNSCGNCGCTTACNLKNKVKSKA
ncbi:MAG: hypothetical protein ACPGJS_13900 [Flammeovirgaceae bacterium]